MPIILTPPGVASGTPPTIVNKDTFLVPLGVEANIEARGLVLGDTSQPDAYVIRSIDGLDDADIRDAREVNPSWHGETPFAAFYGGRTIVISGWVRATGLRKMREMISTLKGTFNTLEEFPLYFRAAQAKHDHFLTVRKNAQVKVAEEQKDFTWRREFSITLRAADPRFYSVTQRFVTMWPNKLPNPSFEANTTGWTNYGASFTGLSFTRDTGWQTHGSYSARIQGTKDNTATARSIGINTTTGTGGVPIAAGSSYSVKAHINANNPASGGVRLKVEFYTAAGAAIAAASGGTWYSDREFSAGIFTLQMTAEAPATAAFMSVWIDALTSTALDVVDIYVDSVWLVRREHTGSLLNVMPNPSFEQSTSGWTHTETTTTLNTFAIDTGWTTPLGVKSLRYKATATGAGTAYVQSDSVAGELTVGNTVTARLDYNVLQKGALGGPKLVLEFYTSGNVFISRVQTTPVATTGQGRLEISTTVPATTSYARIIVGNLNTGGQDNRLANTEVSEFFIDAIVLADTTGYALPAYGWDGGEMNASWKGTDESSASKVLLNVPDYWLEPGVAQMINQGNFETLPVLRITGPLAGPETVTQQPVSGGTYGALKNFMLTPTAIGSNVWREYDGSSQELYDQNFANRFDEYNLASDDFRLDAGINLISLPVDLIGDDSSTIKVTYRDAWL